MRVNNWLSGFACVLLLGVVGCKKDKIREGIPVVVEKVGVDDVETVSYTHLTLPTT